MVAKRCCAYGCKAKSGGGPKFFSFPSCRQRCKDWLKALNRPDILADISGDKYCLLNFYNVCDAHFTKKSDTPVLHVASKGTSTNKTTNMEDTGTCTDETNMEDTGTNTEKTNMDDKATWTKKTKMKDRGTSTLDLGISRLSLTPVDIIDIFDIEPLPAVVIPTAIPTKPISPKPLVPVTNEPSPGFLTAKPNVTKLSVNFPAKPTSTNPNPVVVPVAKPPSPGFITAEPNVIKLPANIPAKPTTVVTDAPLHGCNIEDPNVTKVTTPDSDVAVEIKDRAEKPLVVPTKMLPAPKLDDIWKNSVKSYDTRIRSEKVMPNNMPQLEQMVADDIQKNPVKTYNRTRSATEKFMPTKTSRPEQTATDDIWKNSLKAYDLRIRPTTTKMVPLNTPRPEHMVADDIWKNSKSYDTRSRHTTTKVASSNTLHSGDPYLDIWKNSLKAYTLMNPTTSKESAYFPCDTTSSEHMPVPDDIWKNTVKSTDTQTRATTSRLRNYRKNMVPTIAVQKLHTDCNVTQIPIGETNETRNTGERNSPDIKTEPKSEDTSEITIEEYPLVFNAISERDRIRTPEIKTEPDTNEIDSPEINLEENALGLDDVFKALSERERNSQRLDPAVKVPNLTFKLQMNLPVLEQALTSGPNLRRELDAKDIDENIRTHKRKKKK